MAVTQSAVSKVYIHLVIMYLLLMMASSMFHIVKEHHFACHLSVI